MSRSQQPSDVSIADQVIRSVAGLGSRHGGWRIALRKSARVLRRKGVAGFLRRVRRYVSSLPAKVPTAPWVGRLRCTDAERLQTLCVNRPTLSILIPVSLKSLPQLDECLRSLTGQYYRNWEAILIVGHADSRIVAEWLAGRDNCDARVTAVSIPSNSSKASAMNSGVTVAHGEFMAVLDPTDSLTEDAFSWVIVNLNKAASVSVLYSDSITVDSRGRCVETQFKPDFSPEYLLASHFTQHLTFVSKREFNLSGGFRGGEQHDVEHDLLLRLSEQCPTESISHIARVLCLQRARVEPPNKGLSCIETPSTAVEDALKRRGLFGTVGLIAESPDVYSIRLRPRRNASVTIFVATRNSYSLVRRCLESIRENTAWPGYEIVVINNQSDETDLLNYLDLEQSAGRLRVFDYDRPFNHSEMHNLAVATTDSDLIVFLNNDVYITSTDWLEQMVATAESSSTIGGVGSLLLYPDGTVQHAGLLLGTDGTAGHFHRDMYPADGGNNNRIQCLQEVSGCTAAFVMLKRSAWDTVGGFDADTFPTDFNDVDLWLRLRQAGYRCIYDPLVAAIHDESRTRTIDDAQAVIYRNRLHNRWSSELACDSFHNPNLGPESEQLSVFRDYPIDIEGTIAELTQHAGQLSANRVA